MNYLLTIFIFCTSILVNAQSFKVSTEDYDFKLGQNQSLSQIGNIRLSVFTSKESFNSILDEKDIGFHIEHNVDQILKSWIESKASELILVENNVKSNKIINDILDNEVELKIGKSRVTVSAFASDDFTNMNSINRDLRYAIDGDSTLLKIEDSEKLMDEYLYDHPGSNPEEVVRAYNQTLRAISQSNFGLTIKIDID